MERQGRFSRYLGATLSLGLLLVAHRLTRHDQVTRRPKRAGNAERLFRLPPQKESGGERPEPRSGLFE